MPKVAAHKRRSGDDARGGARINQSDDLPHTKSSDWRHKFQGSSSTADVMGDEPENSPVNKPSYSEVATAMKRHLAERAACHTSGGKCPRTIQRRILHLVEVLAKEQQRRNEYLELEAVCKEALANVEAIVKPEAERLGYCPVFLYIKYQACRIYFAYLAEGHPALSASEEGGWPSLYSGSGALVGERLSGMLARDRARTLAIGRSMCSVSIGPVMDH